MAPSVPAATPNPAAPVIHQPAATAPPLPVLTGSSGPAGQIPGLPPGASEDAGDGALPAAGGAPSPDTAAGRGLTAGLPVPADAAAQPGPSMADPAPSLAAPPAAAAGPPRLRAGEPPDQSAPDIAAPGQTPPAPAAASPDGTSAQAAWTPPFLAARHPPAPDPAPSAGAPPPPPAAQLGQALANLHVRTDGSSRLTIKLDPAELGQVQIRIDRAQDGTATINVAVQRLETLHALQTDVTHLHLALDRAGVPEQQRSLVLHLAPPAPDAGQLASQDFASGGFQQPGRQPGWARPPEAAVPSQFTESFTVSEAPARGPAVQASLNITA